MVSGRSILLLALLTTMLFSGLQIFPAFGQSASSVSYFARGVSQYRAGKYREAITAFESEIKVNPRDANAVYYLADSYRKIGDTAKAIILYNAIVEKFPSTVAARYSRRALLGVSRSISNGHSGSVTLESQDQSGPGTVVVPFSRAQSGHLVVSCLLNGHPQDMIFDTGASVCVATTRQLDALNISVPQNSPTGLATGVSGTVKTRLMPMSIQLGGLKRQVTLSVMESLPTLPLLGESFFGSYQYILDNASGTIKFMKPGSSDESSVPDDTIDIPFERVGQELEVSARINNVDVKLFFDTGAERTVVPASVMQQTMPESWVLKGYGTSSGVGGTGTCKAYQVKSIEVGAIRNYDFEVVVVDRMPIARGLLGQDFFAHRKFTIDNRRNVIRFWR